ncbi:MAG: hypothetical protein JO144_00880 [Actinobacteria bacterium]|nr:hypothetical protein [Actinomycetota bacterium]
MFQFAYLFFHREFDRSRSTPAATDSCAAGPEPIDRGDLSEQSDQTADDETAADETSDDEAAYDEAATDETSDDEAATDETKPAKFRRRVKKYSCPTTFGAVTVGTAIAPRYGLLPHNAAGNPFVLAAVTAVVFGRGLVHVWQGNLSKYHGRMRGLTLANFVPVSVAWAYVTLMAFLRPDSPMLPLLIRLATVLFWFVALVQVIHLDRLRTGKVSGEPAYPGAKGGTAAVAGVRVVPGSVTVGDIGRATWCLGSLFQVTRGRRLSALVIVVLSLNFNLYLSNAIPSAGQHSSTVATSGASGKTANASPSPNARVTPSQPATPSSSPTGSTSAPGGRPDDDTDDRSYDEVCNVGGPAGDPGQGQEPGVGGPDWAADKLNGAWFGPGANVAGCAQGVYTIEDKSCPGAWEMGINGAGAIVSVAIARKCQEGGAIFLGQAATIVLAMLADELPINGSCRRISGDGDVQLVYGSFGTVALVRPDRNFDSDIIVLPPAATAGWARLIEQVGVMVWPHQVSATTWSFQDADGTDRGTVHVSVVGKPALARTGVLTYDGVRYDVTSGVHSLASVTPGAPATCH